MRRQQRTRSRQNQINILHTTTRKRHSQKQVMQATVWCSIVLAMVVAVGVSLHYGIAFVLNQVLYTNPHYTLAEIEIQPRGHFSETVIRQAANLKIGQNLWSLNLPQIAQDLEKLPYVSRAKVERHFPDKLTIVIHERVPVVQIAGLNLDLNNTREPFYLDRDCIVLKPRDDEETKHLPEVIGLTNDELEPGVHLDEPSLVSALQILDAIDNRPLHTKIDIRIINLSNPLAITMVTTQDVSITFRTSADYIDQELSRLQDIFNKAEVLQRSLHTVDLTPNLNVPITFSQ